MGTPWSALNSDDQMQYLNTTHCVVFKYCIGRTTLPAIAGTNV